MQLPCPIAQHAEERPHTVALRLPDRQYTWAEFEAQINQRSAALQAHGVQPGDRIALCLQEPRHYPALLFALFRLRAIAFPLSPHFPKAYLETILAGAPCRFLITDRSDQTPDTITPLTVDSLKEEAPTLPPCLSAYAPDQPATLILTSGSTGRPKAALLSLGNHFTNAALSCMNIPLSTDDSWLINLPCFHVSGLGALFRCVYAGAAMAFPAPAQPLADALTHMPITHISLVGAQLRRALADAACRLQLAGLKALLLGGGPVNPELTACARAAGIPLHTTYGLTEMASQVCTTAPTASLEELATSGQPLSEEDFRLSDTGEICVRGKTLFLGYLENETLQRPLDEAGWFHTGDLGRLNAAGYLEVLGRKDNRFIAGGENIQPEEIEAALMALPGVEAALVVGVPHPDFTTTPVAFLKPLQDLEHIQAALADRLPKYKIPRHILAWPEASPGALENKLSRPHFTALATQRLQQRA